jgi:hypothetical protein
LSGRRGKRHIPTPKGQVVTPHPKGILELDRFTEASITKWNELSADLDELQDVLHFNLEPERRRLRGELISALQQVEPKTYLFDNWVRIVEYRWSLQPLSAAGSLTYIGGRFNAGNELDRNTLAAWPALYIAKNYATAYREKFQLQEGENSSGLTAEELSLNTGHSHTTVILKGELSQVFEMSPDNLNAVARVFAKIKMPSQAEKLRKNLRIKSADLKMLKNGKQLFDLTTIFNWRVLPVQFGLPSQSQVVAELIRSAGYEAISYPSSKDGGECLAIFVDQMADGSFVSLADPAPKGAIMTLDSSTAEKLAGWEILGLRPQRDPL